MAKYVVFFSFTPEAAARYVANPGDRISAVRDLAESAGGSLECSYWMLGRYDGLSIIELPDAQTAAAVSLAVAGSGAFRAFETHELIEPAGYVRVAQRAQQLRFRPPGS